MKKNYPKCAGPTPIMLSWGRQECVDEGSRRREVGEEEKKSGRRRRIERKSDPRAWCVTRDGRDHFSCEESELRTSPAVLHPPWEEGGGGGEGRREEVY